MHALEMLDDSVDGTMRKDARGEGRRRRTELDDSKSCECVKFALGWVAGVRSFCKAILRVSSSSVSLHSFQASHHSKILFL